jgi:hypothetical protein
MPKTKNKKVRSTADLVVGHAERHLEKNPHLNLWVKLTSRIDTLMFAFAGIIVMLAAFHVVNSAGVESPAFETLNATDYSSQQDFYSGESEETHAAAGEFASAKMKVREAAIAMELARALKFIGLFLLVGAIWYLHDQHGIFDRNRAGFTIRKIR